ncbi:TPA: type IV pilus major pilin [Vibrio cholerae]|uniref:type IV pilus major pilin n=1 Tax=Vibrio cholerae TaxID=666 RepID=UPI0022702860|nr:type IV pilus major pilin [Vibrio cholerae]MCX9483638.1 type IV pilus major pilin [Vibrio cholerae]
MKAFEFFSAKRQQFAQRAQAAFAQYKEAKKQRGMTLLEVIIVLGIIGTIAAGVVVLAQRAFDSRTVSEVVQNTNTIRVAIKDVYASSGKYPLGEQAKVVAYTASTIASNNDNNATTTLVKLGKTSGEEMRNKISGDYYAITAGHTSTGTQNQKGYVISVNGLTTEQCRNIIGQVGNNWDYVQVVADAAGSYANLADNGVDMTAQIGTDILKSLASASTIDPAKIVQTCTNPGATNAILLGSR